MRVEFLLEEKSMENFLEVVLPKILPADYHLGVNCFLRAHDGKTDLMDSIPRKIKTFSAFYEPAKIVIIHDQHSFDCKELKNKITELCTRNGTCPVLIRLACRELESWYIGDLDAVEQAYPKTNASKLKAKQKYRNPDKLEAAEELSKLTKDFQKGEASKNIPKHMVLENNNSKSFNVFITGLKRFLV